MLAELMKQVNLGNSAGTNSEANSSLEGASSRKNHESICANSRNNEKMLLSMAENGFGRQAKKTITLW